MTLIAVMLLSACSNDSGSSYEEPDPAVPGSPVDKRPHRIMRFSVSDNRIGSRVSHDNYESWFEDGESIGCIIAYYEDGQWVYQANSEWTYSDELKGILMLRNVWTGTEKLSWDKLDGNIIKREDERADMGYLELLNPDAKYGFFFYYPFIDSDIINELHTAIHGHTEKRIDDVFYIPYAKNAGSTNGISIGEDVPHAGWDFPNDQMTFNRIVMVGEMYKEYQEYTQTTWSYYNWEKYPCFVCYDQRNKRTRSLSPEIPANRSSNNSDFMTATYIVDQLTGSDPITQDNATYEVGLSMRKKMAAIDIIFDYAPIEEPWFDSDEGAIVGKALNIPTGVFTDYQFISRDKNNDLGSGGFDSRPKDEAVQCVNSRSNPGYDEWGNNPANNQWELLHFILTKNKFYPYHFPSTNTYRLIMPAQQNLDLNCHFTSQFGQEIELKLGEQITELKENHIYRIRFIHDAWSIEIRDWLDDSDQILQEEDF